ncbi:MAG: vitamin K epoxide reductase family protein, partial [Bacteroidota bacterium]
MKGTLSLLLKTLLLKNNYRLDFKELEFQLLSHPSYPSLYAVTSVLEHFGVENLALEVPTDMQTLQQLPVTFLSVTNSRELVLVEKLDSGVKLTFNGNTVPKRFGYQDFLEIWSGMALGIEEGVNGRRDGKVASNWIPQVFLLISIVIPIILFLNSLPDLFQASHFFAGLVGLFISILIVRHELGSQSGLMNRFCNAYDSTSCDALLKSKGAMVLHLFKLSDACVVYFSVTTFSWVIYVAFGYYGGVFPVLSLLGLPVIMYSLYYQYYVMKKWCPLCLGISVVLFVQAITVLFTKDEWIGKLDFSETLILLFSAISIITVWAFIRPLLSAKRKFAELKIEHHRFKRNFDLFQSAHSKSTSYSTQLANFNTKEIILGNPNGKISLVLVTSPLCIYCKTAHSELEAILDQYPKDICLTIRFNIPTNDSANIGFKVANRLNELFLFEGDSENF